MKIKKTTVYSKMLICQQNTVSINSCEVFDNRKGLCDEFDGKTNSSRLDYYLFYYRIVCLTTHIYVPVLKYLIKIR